MKKQTASLSRTSYELLLTLALSWVFFSTQTFAQTKTPSKTQNKTEQKINRSTVKKAKAPADKTKKIVKSPSTKSAPQAAKATTTASTASAQPQAKATAQATNAAEEPTNVTRQPTSSTNPATKPVTQTVPTSSQKKSSTEKPVKTPNGFRSMTTQLITWQETIKGEKSGVSGRMETKSNGILMTYDFVNYFSGPRWAYYLSPSAGVGNLKGQMQIDSTPDGLKNQIWILAGAHAGFIYRTSPVSQWGIGIPAFYRSIMWDIKDGSALELEKKSSFSAGVEAFLGFAANKSNYIRTAVTYQAQWDATIWGVAWQRRL